MTETPFEDRDARRGGIYRSKTGSATFCCPNLGRTDPGRAAGPATTERMKNGDREGRPDWVVRIGEAEVHQNASTMHGTSASEEHRNSTGCRLTHGLPEHRSRVQQIAGSSRE